MEDLEVGVGGVQSLNIEADDETRARTVFTLAAAYGRLMNEHRGDNYRLEAVLDAIKRVASKIAPDGTKD